MWQSLKWAGIAGAFLSGFGAAAQSVSCLDGIASAEHKYHLPTGLLLSVALAESGRTEPHSGQLAPWPWTVHDGDRGRFFDTPGEAADWVKARLEQGQAHVDVGCMQIDLFHHPRAFATLTEAFSPRQNADYAAALLSGLYRTHRSWDRAISAYNAGNPESEAGAAYAAKVRYFWRAEKPGRRSPQTRHLIIAAELQPLDVAATFLASGEYDSAWPIFRQRLARQPDDLVALRGGSECLIKLGRGEEARSLLLQAIGNAPERADLVELYITFIESEPAGQRLDHLLAARSVSPQSARLRAQIAYLWADSGQGGNALAEQAEAIRLAPEDLSMRLNFALMLDRFGALESAGDAYAQFLALARSQGFPPGFPFPEIGRRYRYLLERANAGSSTPALAALP